MTDESGSVTSEPCTATVLGGDTVEAVSKVIIDCIAEFGEIDRSEIQRSSLLETLDIDSLDLVEMAQILEEQFGIVVEPAHMKDVTTVGDAIDAIASLLPSQ